MSTDRIRVEITGDSKDLQAAALQAVAALKGLDSTVNRMNRSGGIRRLGDDSSRSRVHVDNLSVSLRDLKMVGIGGLISLIPAASSGLAALGSGAVQATAGLAPLVGLLGTLPVTLGAIGGAIGTTTLAFKDMDEAIKGNQKAYERLTDDGKRFVVTLHDEVQPKFEQMQATAQKGLFPGVADGIREAAPLLDHMDRLVGKFAGSLSDMAERGGEVLGSRGFIADFNKLGDASVRQLDRMGRGSFNLTHAIEVLGVEAIPMTDQLSAGFVGVTRDFDGLLTKAQKSGDLRRFFAETAHVTDNLVDAIGDLGGALIDIGVVAYPFGRRMLDNLGDLTDKFHEWTSSAQGRNALKDFFEDTQEPLHELWLLLGRTGEVLGVFIEEGMKPLGALAQNLREDAAPLLEDLARLLGDILPPLIEMLGFLLGALEPIVEVLGDIADANGALGLAATTGAVLGLAVAWRKVKNMAGGAFDAMAGGGKIGRGGGVGGGGIMGSRGPVAPGSIANPIAVVGLGGGGGPGGAPIPGGKGPKGGGGPVKWTTRLARGARVAGRVAGPIAIGAGIIELAFILGGTPGDKTATGGSDLLGKSGRGMPTRTKLEGTPMPSSRNLVDTRKALGLAKAFEVEAVHTRRVSAKLVKDLDKNFEGMAPAARKRAAQAIVAMASTLESQNKLPDGAADKLRKALNKRWEGLGIDSEREARQAMRKMQRELQKGRAPAVGSMKRTMDNVVGTVAKGGQGVIDATNAAIKPLGIDPIRFDLKGLAKNLAGKAEGVTDFLHLTKARGGYLEGSGLRDTVPVMAAPGEAFLTRHQQVPVEHALRNTYGIGLGDLFNRNKRPHYMAKGGRVVGASMFGGPSDPGTGHIGYKGDDLRGTQSYAELDMGTALGNLPYKHPLFISHGKRTVRALKRDIGAGGGDVQGRNRAIDLWYETARALRFSGVGLVGISDSGKVNAAGAAIADQIKRLIVQGPEGGLKDLGQAAVDKIRKAANDYISKQQPKVEASAGAVGGGKSGGFDKAGLVNWEGWQVADWIAKELRWARSKGWTGNITSGYRSHAHNVAQGRTYHSLHEDTVYPGGAVDFGGPGDSAGRLAFEQVVGTDSSKYPHREKLIHVMQNDLGHMSGTGYNLGGFIDQFAPGGLVRSAADPPQKNPNSPPEEKAKAETESDRKEREAALKRKRKRKLEADRKARAKANRRKVAALIKRLRKPFKSKLPDLGRLDHILGKQVPNIEDLLALREREFGRSELLDPIMGRGEIIPGHSILDIGKEEVADLTVAGQHVSRDDTLLAYKRGRREHLQRAVALIRKLLAQVAKAIRERQERINEINRKIKAERKKKKPNKTLLKRLNTELKRQTDGTAGTSLKALQEDQGTLRSRMDEVTGTGGFGGSLFSAGQDVLDTESHRQSMTPPGLRAQLEGRRSADAGSEQTLADLMREQNELLKKTALLGSRGDSIFSEFKRDTGLPYLGAFQHGTRARVSETGFGLLHKDEHVVADDEGPYGRNRARGGSSERPIVIQLHGNFPWEHVDARIDGKVAKVDQRIGRDSRLISIAPGR